MKGSTLLSNIRSVLGYGSPLGAEEENLAIMVDVEALLGTKAGTKNTFFTKRLRRYILLIESAL